MKIVWMLLVSGSIVCAACEQRKAAPPASERKAGQDSVPQKEPDAPMPVKVRTRLTDQQLDEYLRPVHDNIRRINGIQKWTFTSKKDLEESTEGGEADFYYLDGKLEKVVYRQFGETFQNLTEFYMMDGKLCFAFEKRYLYNRPIYWDSTAMLENGDNQAWDAEKSEITETRSYFLDGRLVRQDRTGRTAPLTNLTPEEKRISRQFEAVFPEPAVQ